MNLKKIFVIFVIASISFVVSACNDGNLITGLEIASYPNRLFYVVGIDSELDLDGGMLYILTRGRPEPVEENRISMNSERNFVIHDINFNVPGIYTVYFKRGVELRYSVSFPVQVISLEEIKKIIEDKLEE